MPELFFSVLTNKGIEKYTAADAAGPIVNLTQLAVGDSGGAYFDPLPTQVSLVNEVARVAINSIYVHQNNNNWMVVEGIIPAATGGFDIREAGLFDAAGDLIAAAKYPLTNKPATGSGCEKDLYVRLIFERANAANVTQQIDPSLVTATKEYVDTRDWRESARAATTANIADLAAGAPDTLDGVALAAGDRILVKDQAAGEENGIYAVQTVGTGADGAWIRSADADTGLDISANFTVAIEEGTANADSIWTMTTNHPITLGTTALTFKQMITQTELDAHTGDTGNPHGVTAAQVGAEAAFAAGTKMVFVQNAAPAGWTLDATATKNQAGLRIVTTAAQGGQTGGSADAFAAHTHSTPNHGHTDTFAVAGHTLTTTEMPVHNHPIINTNGGVETQHFLYGETGAAASYQSTNYTSNAGSGGSHSHGLTGAVSNGGGGNTGSFSPKYVNALICTKD